MNRTHTFPAIKRAFILALFIFSINSFIEAQKDTVIIIGANKPIINDAFKINENPKVFDTTVEKPNLSYQINPKLYPTTFSVDPIKPAKMLGQPLTKLYKSYIKVGFGNKTTPLIEFNYSNLRSTNEAIGVYFDHLSSSGKIKDYAFPGYSDNEGGIYADKFYRNHTLSADINYTRNVVHYYGFKPSNLDTLPNISNLSKKDSIKQRFAKLGGTLKFKSNYLDSSRFNHFIDLKYFHLLDLYHATEDYVGFNAGVDKNIHLLGKSFKSQNLGINADVNYYNDENKINNSSGAAVCLLPHYSFNLDILKFYIGMNASVRADNDSKLFLYPDANASLDIYNEFLVVYGGITGGLERNNLIDISAENPFINTSVSLLFTNTKLKYFGGFKGSISSRLSYNAYVSESNIANLPLYQTYFLSPLCNQFIIVYDNVKIFDTHLEVAYQKNEKIKLMLSSDYYQYTTTYQQYAWYKPDEKITFSFDYNLQNKIIVKAGIFAISKVHAQIPLSNGDYSGVASTLKGTVDGNLGLEYRYNKILSAFINFNNVGAVRYQQWYNYPTYGFTVLGGITYSF